ncbi:MAG TPA: hypothetical protein VFQ61_06690 [Polyangiaceae bacterium]|nr:hypothetical protein [Polyangiaceae bacterium]
MATNRELIDQAEALGKKLGEPVQTQGLSSSALQDLVTDLQKRVDQAAQLRPLANEPPKSREPNKPNDQPTTAERNAGQQAGEQPKSPYLVAKGRSVIGARGVIDEGKEITPEDVGGQENLDRHVAAGNVDKR